MSGWQWLFVALVGATMYWLGKIAGMLQERADQLTARADREKMIKFTTNESRNR